jgi:hypothetical protein
MTNVYLSTAEKIKVMQAYIDGRLIEIRVRHSNGLWKPLNRALDSIQWNWEKNEYRVKELEQ